MAKAATDHVHPTRLPIDFRLALLTVLLEPALLCAEKWGLTLADVETATTTGYFRVVRRNRTMRRCAERLALSTRQAFRLQNDASGNVWLDELNREELPRRILQELAGGVKTERALTRLAAANDVHAALAMLVDSGTIVIAKGKPKAYRLAKARTGLVDPHGLRFLDGIRFALWPVVQTIFARTDQGFRPQSSPKSLAWARVFTFAAERPALTREADLILADALRRIEALDHQATHAPTEEVSHVHLALWLAEDAE